MNRERIKKAMPHVAALIDAASVPRTILCGGSGGSTRAAHAEAVLRRIRASLELRRAERINQQSALLEARIAAEQGEGANNSTSS